MEAFSLLKYSKRSSSSVPGGHNTRSTTMSSAANHDHPIETDLDYENESDDDEDGPFIDLEFDVHEENSTDYPKHCFDGYDSDNLKKEEYQGDQKLKFSSSINDLFSSKGKVLVPIATKLRVLMLGLKKSSKINSLEKLLKKTQLAEEEEFVKLKVEEIPVVSLSKENWKNIKLQKQNNIEECGSDSDEKRVPKDLKQKYLKKTRFSRQLTIPSMLGKSTTAITKSELEMEGVGGFDGVKNLKQKNLQADMRTMSWNLSESPSASSAAARDDSLLHQEDGIQGAILHCKRSFNSSLDTEASLIQGQRVQANLITRHLQCIREAGVNF